MRGALGVGQAELERVLGRQERHHTIARHIRPEIDHEMPQVVFFARADGAVGEEHERLAPDQAADRMIRVDPRIASGGGIQLRARRPKLDRHERRRLAEHAHERAFLGSRHQGQYKQAAPRTSNFWLLTSHLT